MRRVAPDLAIGFMLPPIITTCTLTSTKLRGCLFKVCRCVKATTGVVFVLLLVYAFVGPTPARAEDGSPAWLRYAPLNGEAARAYASLPAATGLLGDTLVLTTAQSELVRGVKSMLGRTLRVSSYIPHEDAILIGTFEQLRKIAPRLKPRQNLSGDGYWLTSAQVHGHRCIVILGTSDRGALYGVFAFLAELPGT
jgi:hypothetical protein